MAYPYVNWGLPTPYQPHPSPYPQHYAIPAILPSSSPFVSNPEGAIRDLTEHVTNGDRDQMCDSHRLQWFAEWGKNADHRKIIMDVLKVRMDLVWPYNYKALDILSVMPVSELPGLQEKLTKMNEGTGEGAAELKKVLKPLLEKAAAEKKKQEEEEMKKREAAVLQMWGGLWANDGYKHPALAGYGWGGFPYPYSGVGIVPGISLPPPGVEWKSKAPEGWQGYVLIPVPISYSLPILPYPVRSWPPGG